MRLLIYSHDSFGLGHLRRCRAIAHSLVEQRRDLSVLILSGSPIIGSYAFHPRVDFIRFPGVVKLRNGGYTAHGLDISIEDAIDIRETIIRSAAGAFRPHIFLVDKEPLGLRGEVGNTLTMLRGRGTRIVLGLRDILDESETLQEEWLRKNAMAALRDFYDDIWVYGCEGVTDPLEGLDVPSSVRQKMTYTGYLRRSVPAGQEPPAIDGIDIDRPFILVTTGGGGDGTALVDSVMRAYEQAPEMGLPAVIVLGPFMKRNVQHEFMSRAEHLENVCVIDFVSNFEALMQRAVGVVAMGGYNTFCEILSFDKPSIIVPRTIPRLEQAIRAQRMQDLGLVRMVSELEARDPLSFARAIQSIVYQPRPSERRVHGLMDGFSIIGAMVDDWLSDVAEPRHVLEVIHGVS